MKDKLTHYWICYFCAKERGGVWPKGHVATATLQKCKYCCGKNQEDMTVFPFVDFDWPDKKLTKFSRMNRD